ncbi:MAG: threonylcarbamoyl-AMP synthase [Chloroflexi bacterium]|nr:threonylcarbamoyl-AMP synthase [Chloroflexota bacterium]
MRPEIARVDPENPDVPVMRRAARLILAGEVLVCPTDTGYAFGANALDETAVKKVFDLKGRSFNNPIHITVSSLDEAARYAEVTGTARKLGRRFLPGALTLVLKKRANVPSLLVAGRDTIGIRVPANRVILDLAAMSGAPVTSTSANRSGQPTPYTVEEVVAQLGEDADKPALFLDQGELASHALSTIVDLTVSPPALIRSGLITWEAILQALNENEVR